MDTGNELTSTFRLGLAGWYDFRSGSSALYIGEAEEAVPLFLASRGLRVTCTSVEKTLQEDWHAGCRGAFDYLICVADLEYCREPEAILSEWRELLAENGVLLLGMNNRLGIRYFCGDCDPYTKQVFDGVDGYRHAAMSAENFRGRMYSRAETGDMLRRAGFSHVKSYSVLPDLEHPFLLYADGCLSNENLATRVQPLYHSPGTVFLEEEVLYQSLEENGLFHGMANAFLWECPLDGGFADVQHVTCSVERGRENSLFTLMRACGTVEKRAIFPEGETRLRELAKNMEALEEHGLTTVPGKLEGNRYVMPFMAEETGQVYLKRLLLGSKTEMLEAMDRFRGEILRSSETVSPDRGDGWGATLAQGYYDLVPLNSFYAEGRFVFFDQEFSYANFPANAVIYRMIASFYAGNEELKKILPEEELFARYGLLEHLDVWRSMDKDFIAALRNFEALAEQRSKSLRDPEIMMANRHRMNYSDADYQQHIVEPLLQADTRKLFLFGSGRYARRFLESYGEYYEVHAILDNQESKWGTALNGIEIHAPEFLQQFSHGEYKVLICVQDYSSIANQLKDMGISEYGIFDPGKVYPRPRKSNVLPAGNQSGSSVEGKKYHVGYVAGVFDLFHIGHLNVFRRAKEQCDYLIVGVVSDRQVREGKKVEPFVPFEERLEMVKSCRYVDEAHEIPFEHPDTDMAWKLYHFDVQFSGSDYEHDPVWLKKKEWLEERGSTMVFFPYTQSTSSTRLKKLIEERLI